MGNENKTGEVTDLVAAQKRITELEKQLADNADAKRILELQNQLEGKDTREAAIRKIETLGLTRQQAEAVLKNRDKTAEAKKGLATRRKERREKNAPRRR
jgi:hypothetical protein